MGNNKRLQDYTLISGQGTPKDGNNGSIDIRDQFVDRSNTLEFYRNSGDVVYIDKSGEKHNGHFSPRGNGYALLAFLIQHPGRIFAPDDIIFNEQREGGDSTPDRRVRDTIQTVKKELGLIKDKTNDFFIVDKGFGISCKVEIKP